MYNRKLGGNTPITVLPDPLRVMRLPTMLESAPKRLTQIPYERTTPPSGSPGAKSRPCNGAMPKSENRLSEATTAESRSGSAPSLNVIVLLSHIAMSVKTRLRVLKSR